MKAMITRNVVAQRLANWLPTGDGTGKSDDDLSVALWSGTWLMPYTDETLKMLGEKGVGIYR